MPRTSRCSWLLAVWLWGAPLQGQGPAADAGAGEAAPDAGTETGTETEAEAETGTETEAETGTATETGAETGTATETEAGTGAEAETETGAEAESEKENGAEAEVGAVSAPMDESAADTELPTYGAVALVPAPGTRLSRDRVPRTVLRLDREDLDA